MAIVAEVLPHAPRFAEQNLDHRPWPEGRAWSREIKARTTEPGEYWVESSFADATILGWVLQTDDDPEAEPLDDPDPDLLNLVARELP